MYGDFEAVIGLEIHAQLTTKSKLFSPASTEFGQGDNENVSTVCAGLPGALPVPNRKAIELAIKTGIALNCKVEPFSVLSRKQYFYPDLPKGYQISQFDKPICSGGYVEFYLDEEVHRVNLERAHLEEDAGKSTHFGEFTLVNLNRAGIPLMEIVTAPVITSPKQAAAYARAVRQILIFSDVCDGNLEEGSMRCDCNISVRKIGVKELGTKVELKNINSFRFIEKAVEYEIHRQIDQIQHGEEIVQETRLYDSTKNKTFSMRSKEEAADYRYFPDPDLLPILISSEEVEKVSQTMPEMPMARMKRMQADYSLSLYESEILTSELFLAQFFEETVAICKNAKIAANWLIGEFLGLYNESKTQPNSIPIKPPQLAEMIQLIDDKTISGKIAKQVFAEMWKTSKDPKTIVADMGLEQITDDSKIRELVLKVVNGNPDKVAEYKGGKQKLFGFFVGQVMKQSQGKANPEMVNKVLKEELEKK